MNEYIYYIIMSNGVLIAGLAQVLLKKASQGSYSKWYKQYLNLYVVSGYFMMLISTMCTVIAMQKVPLITTPIWNSSGIILAAVMGRFFFGEVMSKRRRLGFVIVIVGILLFTMS